MGITLIVQIKRYRDFITFPRNLRAVSLLLLRSSAENTTEENLFKDDRLFQIRRLYKANLFVVRIPQATQMLRVQIYKGSLVDHCYCGTQVRYILPLSAVSDIISNLA